MKTQQIHFGRTAWARLRSWLAFIFAAVIITIFYYGCYTAIRTWLPDYLPIVRWLAYTVISAGLIALIFNEPIIVRMTHAKRLKHRSQNPKLWEAMNQVVSLAVSVKPRVYHIQSRGCNAFAFGWGLPWLSGIAVTDGLINKLSKPELEAVVAHEMGHLRNKDVFITMAMMVSVMIVGYTGWLILGFTPFADKSRHPINNLWLKLAAVIFGGTLYYTSRSLGAILQLFVSREREFAADAIAVRALGSSLPLISALSKISQLNTCFINSRVDAAIGFLCTADPNPQDYLSTHPPFVGRIKALAKLHKK